MEKELDIKVQIAEIIKDNATINGLTKYFEMDQDNINDAVAEIYDFIINYANEAAIEAQADIGTH